METVYERRKMTLGWLANRSLPPCLASFASSRTGEAIRCWGAYGDAARNRCAGYREIERSRKRSNMKKAGR